MELLTITQNQNTVLKVNHHYQCNWNNIMTAITGELKWDLFAFYIVISVMFIGSCCVVVSCLFLCHPAKSLTSLNIARNNMRRSKTEPELENAKKKLQTRRSNSFHGKENSFHWKTLSRQSYTYLIKLSFQKFV